MSDAVTSITTGCLSISVHSWVVEILSCTATLPRGSGQWNSYNALHGCLGAFGSGTPAMHCLTDCGERATVLLQCTAIPPRGGGQGNSSYAMPHYLGAVGSANPIMHCQTANGRWAVDVLQCTASLHGGKEQRNPYSECTSTVPGGSGQ